MTAWWLTQDSALQHAETLYRPPSGDTHWRHHGLAASDADDIPLSGHLERSGHTVRRVVDEVLSSRTDRLDPDTDHDGLDSGDEVLIHRTDLFALDTDAGGRSDGDEVYTDRTDPLRGSDERVSSDDTSDAVAPGPHGKSGNGKGCARGPFDSPSSRWAAGLALVGGVSLRQRRTSRPTGRPSESTHRVEA